MDNPSKTTRLAAIAATLTLTLTVAACGEDDSGAEPAAVRTAPNGDLFNDVDVEFATQMIPHHAQALEMVDLTFGRELSPEVQALADEIRGAQAPEVEQMSDWLISWGEQVPATSLDHANAHNDGEDMDDMAGMPGMMSGDEMDQLEGASDAEFEPLFLEMMIEHHTGAVEMAQAEQDDGEYADAVDLAAAIEAGQTEEIETMDALLDS